MSTFDCDLQTSGTIITSSKNDELSPIESALMDLCNQIHVAREQSDRHEIESLQTHAFALLDQYDATDGEDHPNPAWARPNQRALVLSALGRLEESIKLELTAVKYADTPRRLEISMGNVADRCIRSGENEEAIGFFLEAYDANPGSIPILLTGAHAMFAIGEHEQANDIFRILLDSDDEQIINSELELYLECDPRTNALRYRLSNLELLYRRWELAQDQLGGAL